MASAVLLKRADVEERLKIGRTKFFALIKSGELRSVQIGRARRVPLAALEEYVEQLEGKQS